MEINHFSLEIGKNTAIFCSISAKKQAIFRPIILLSCLYFLNKKLSDTHICPFWPKIVTVSCMWCKQTKSEKERQLKTNMRNNLILTKKTHDMKLIAKLTFFCCFKVHSRQI